jgi:hypothetical protein
LETFGPFEDCAPFAPRFNPFAPPFDPLAIVRFLRLLSLSGASPQRLRRAGRE